MTLRFVTLGLAALAVLWVALWLTEPSPKSAAAGAAGDTPADFARRISAPAVPAAAPLSIAVQPASTTPGGAQPAPPVHHDRAAAKALWAHPPSSRRRKTD